MAEERPEWDIFERLEKLVIEVSNESSLSKACQYLQLIIRDLPASRLARRSAGRESMQAGSIE
jgi:hypothetical protein